MMKKTLIAVAATALLGAGCAANPTDGLPLGEPDTQPIAGTAPAQTTAAAAQQAAPAEPAGTATGSLTVARSSTLGDILTDERGMTVYRFDSDTARPPASSCAGDCATAWPPVLVDDPAALTASGVDSALLGTLERPDGGVQLTVAGWPAYLFSKDRAPGDVRGQGAGDKWFVFAPDGKKATGALAKPLRLTVMRVAGLGEIVTDREGMTLYRFDEDDADPSRATCDGGCAEKWPPLLTEPGSEPVLDGIDPADVGTVTRSDGSVQITVGGWPLYRFSGDRVPCDTNGHGVGGTWFATTATGGKAGS